MTPESALLYLELPSTVLMADAVQPLTDAAINTSNKAGGEVMLKVLLYMKFRSSIRAASSVTCKGSMTFVRQQLEEKLK